MSSSRFGVRTGHKQQTIRTRDKVDEQSAAAGQSQNVLPVTADGREKDHGRGRHGSLRGRLILLLRRVIVYLQSLRIPSDPQQRLGLALSLVGLLMLLWVISPLLTTSDQAVHRGSPKRVSRHHQGDYSSLPLSKPWVHSEHTMPFPPRVLILGDEGDVTLARPVEGGLPPRGQSKLKERYIELPSFDGVELKAASKVDKGKCQRLADWQVGHHPNCNVIHESSSGFVQPLDTINEDVEQSRMEKNVLHEDKGSDEDSEDSDENKFNHPEEQIRLAAGGAFRWVWMIREYDGVRRALKTLRIDGAKKSKDFDLRNFDRHRRDAVSMDELTKSPLIVDIYGYCSNSALFDWGEGGDLFSIFEREPDISKEQLLRIAYNVSMSVHDAHNFDSEGRPTIAHTDIKPDQFLYQDGYYRLTDFNRVRFLTWDHKKNKQCGFNVGKNGGVWRSPEEYAYYKENEKVDVYSLGNVLYWLLTQEEVWDGYRSKEVYQMVMDKLRPRIPQKQKESNHPFDRYMIEAIKMAWTHLPSDRPGALEVAEKLEEGIKELESKQWKDKKGERVKLDSK